MEGCNGVIVRWVFRQRLFWLGLNVVFFVGVCAKFVELHVDKVALAQTTPLGASATVQSAASISVGGALTSDGKQTLFSGGGIDFGQVSFLQPELVSNGSAYRVGGLLRLEAVFDVNVQFGGVNTVLVRLSKVQVSTNRFEEIYYTTSVLRSAVPVKVMEYPDRTEVTRLTTPETVKLRLLFDLTPQHQGTVKDRVQVEVSSI